MATKKMLLNLEESTFKALGHLAVERGTSKSALVREFIDAGLARGHEVVTMPITFPPAPKLAPPSFVQPNIISIDQPVDDRMYKALEASR